MSLGAWPGNLTLTHSQTDTLSEDPSVPVIYGTAQHRAQPDL